eukprot:350516-Chlamydomonas_euryale.AAC.1
MQVAVGHHGQSLSGVMDSPCWASWTVAVGRHGQLLLGMQGPEPAFVCVKYSRDEHIGGRCSLPQHLQKKFRATGRGKSPLAEAPTVRLHLTQGADPTSICLRKAQRASKMDRA